MAAKSDQNGRLYLYINISVGKKDPLKLVMPFCQSYLHVHSFPYIFYNMACWGGGRCLMRKFSRMFQYFWQPLKTCFSTLMQNAI